MIIQILNHLHLRVWHSVETVFNNFLNLDIFSVKGLIV